MTGQTATRTTHIGGHMYGDGEYVVEFSNVSGMAPLRASVIIIATGRIYNAEFDLGSKASVKLAAQVIAQVRREEATAR